VYAPRTAYSVETRRLHLRCWSPTDAPRVRESLDASDRHLRPWIPFMAAEPRSLDETTEWLRQRRAWFDSDENYAYGIFLRDEPALVGEVLLLRRAGEGARELGYWIDARRAGHGYATEASSALVRIAFEVDEVERVELHCAPENAPSVAVARKLGFTLEATLRDRYRDTNDELRDLMVWTLFAADYPTSPARAVPIVAADARGETIAIPD
jgi:RimJ/RimL family protein N-acetyltransferase